METKDTIEFKTDKGSFRFIAKGHGLWARYVYLNGGYQYHGSFLVEGRASPRKLQAASEGSL